MEAVWHINNMEYIPAWNKNHVNTNNTLKCMYPECTANSSNEKIVVPTENTRALFSTLPDTDLSLIGALCERHYQQLYRQVHAPSPCAGCGAKPKARHRHTRHSPDAITITDYLIEHTDFGVTITSDDVLCKACYNMHLAILNSIDKSK